MLRFVPALLCLAWPLTCPAVSPLNLTGALAGTVRDAIGKPQMGAMVFLYDHRDKLCERVLTTSQGTFSFGGLVPDFYSVKVTAASFLPAVRDRIQIEAGVRRLLEVNLSNLFSSIQIVAPEAGNVTLIGDDWKWVLRSSTAMRPVLRILPQNPAAQQRNSTVFSDTRGIVKVSGGDSAVVSGIGSEADLGTSFAVATSVYGTNQLQLIGNFGYAPGSGLPSGGFSTTLSRPIGNSVPEIAITMQQLAIPARVNFPGAGLLGPDGGPRLRTMAVSLSNRSQISDRIDVEYGMEMDSISYLDRLHYFSPYARLTYEMPFATADFTYTAGNARPSLGGSSIEQNADLEGDVAALSRIPRMSLREGKAKVQWGEDYEMSLSRAIGSREYRVAAYRESVRNAALTIAGEGNLGEQFSGDILPDVFSTTSVFNAGNYTTLGYTASVTQKIGDNYRVTVSYGSVGVLLADGSGPVDSDDALRALFHVARRNAVTTRASGTVPVTGTRFTASYEWTDYRAATSAHIYSTNPAHPEPGLNICLRQPIPTVFNIPPHLEASAEFRNLLAQGYLPFSLTNGQTLLLMRTPRSFRGGLSFTF